ncbi:metallo-beta-lactamase domain-containing protein 1-like isoform X2 [Apostichopus japonicus]|uniref:metallo-beta-lactamase domain-containing protein 1-like isoform X2 n=1 Tax=Stichopus japonicus TaxID=307972 RepID=UPI003AB3E5CC
MEVIVLKEGYCRDGDAEGHFKASGTITLIKGEHHNVLVDTGSPWDTGILITELARQDMAPNDIHYVVCTHGHSDHVGNLNLFLQSTHIVGYDIAFKDDYQDFEFKEGKSYEIEDNIEVIPTPGHMHHDVSVIVRNTQHRTVVVAGDLFESAEDDNIWQKNSENLEMQEQSRQRVLQIADFIIPGHGPGFKVPKPN